uniref:Glycosyltransferase sugar-binding region containing DXD motif-containing protein n=1 Tax=Candidatus Kentrum sp. FW TaxID=2126338 RepID=A0A450SHR8_9GAMM|nr:MAG: Glycosyltransferase sugar-binding region containing DXD motif-containing protein [Candidatus Kentron sp. FW]
MLDGREVLDANPILPERYVSREDPRSGLHAGSVGAFSDLFRYHLLYHRGGMWTDTDVINFRRFDTDGRRFMSTEIIDGGLTGLNGALMAVPAGDKFMELACERSLELIESKEMFFTRIGPYLLAELLVEERADEFDLMPPFFLNPVPWMRTVRDRKCR